MTNFVAWIPPAGAVVDPPVHPLTAVRLFWSDESITGPQFAGDVNWSGEGDGFSVVAYAVVEEYKPAPKVAREWWITMHQGFAWDSEEQAKRNSYDGAIHHVREVPQGREVVGWAVMYDGDAVDVWPSYQEASARRFATQCGGAVVKLSGVMPS